MTNRITYSFRRLRTALATAAISLPLVMAASIVHTETLTESDLNIWSVAAPNGDMLTRVSGSGMYGGGEVGSPEIPCKVIRFLVPGNAEDFSVEIEDMSEAGRIELANPLFPVQAAIPINDYSDDKFVYPDPAAYSLPSAPFRAEVLEESVLEGRYHIVSIGLWPLAYTGNPNSLELCGKMRVRLDFRETDTPTFKAPRQAGPTYVDIAGLVVNPEDAPADLAKLAGGGFSPIGQFIGHYYIISERSLLPALEDFAVWKTQKGYRVETVAIEDIYEDSRYRVGTNGIVDEAESLRRYLQDEFYAFGSFFCLLVGDHKTRMPIRRIKSSRNGELEEMNGGNYTPTDIYFSDLSDTNGSLKQDVKGFYISDAKSYSPSIYVGRLLCHSSDQISNYISKILVYECNPGRGDSGYLDSALMTVMKDGEYRYEDTLNAMNEVFANTDCMVDVMIGNPEASHYPTGEMMLEAINGSGYCSLIGHGEPTTISCSGIKDDSSTWEHVKALERYRERDKHNPDAPHESMISNISSNCGIDLMTNIDKPSVIYTIACTTEPFDVYKSPSMEFDFEHTMASSFTCGGRYGGVAYLGNTRSGYWGSSNDLENDFINRLKDSSKVGVAEGMSKVGTRAEMYIRSVHNLIGDPEFEIWKKSPENMNLNLSWNNDDVAVSGLSPSDVLAVINSGDGVVKTKEVVCDPLCMPILKEEGKLNSVGIFRSGYLPVVRIDCYDDNLSECSKQFVVKDAQIGKNPISMVSIGQNSNIRIRAVDSICCGEGLIINSGGKMILQCDKTISMEGVNVEDNGCLVLKGEQVVLSNGFKVRRGGKLEIGH